MSYYVGKEKCLSMSSLIRRVLTRKQVSDGCLVSGVMYKKGKQTDTKNMWQSKRRAALAYCRDSRVVGLSAVSTDTFATVLSSCAMNLQFKANAEMR